MRLLRGMVRFAVITLVGYLGLHGLTYPGSKVVPSGFIPEQDKGYLVGFAHHPQGHATEWTELTLQQVLAGNTTLYIFPLCVLLVFLSLAAQYESWSLPFAIILIVPMCLLSAIFGVWLCHQDNNIFTQIGVVVLVGLACKNAILIVEFAKEQQEREQKDHETAALDASRLRLRPTLMTSFAFILGVVPLVRATSAGAEMRQALGTPVFFGTLGITVFGLLLTPVFYVVIQWFKERDRPDHVAPPAAATPPAEMRPTPAPKEPAAVSA